VQNLPVILFTSSILLIAKYYHCRAKKADNPTADIPSFEFSPNSSNTTLRKHLGRHHRDEYINVCSSNSWQNRLSENPQVVSGASNLNRENFSDEAFLQKIVKWIVGDDQVSNSAFF